jgi:hypothetical protein
MPPDCYARSARPQPDAAIAEIRMPLPTPARASPPPGRSAPRTPAVSVLILSQRVLFVDERGEGLDDPLFGEGPLGLAQRGA